MALSSAIAFDSVSRARSLHGSKESLALLLWCDFTREVGSFAHEQLVASRVTHRWQHSDLIKLRLDLAVRRLDQAVPKSEQECKRCTWAWTTRYRELPQPVSQATSLWTEQVDNMDRIRQGLGLELNDEEKQQGDPNEHIFDGGDTRRTLHRQMSQLSPRRQSETPSEQYAITTLPFYQDISPSAALGNLFDWFCTGPAVVGETTSSSDGQEQHISRDGFNRLRKCVGKHTVIERDWKRALDELGVEAPTPNTPVTRRNFKALFGPPPYFGSSDVQKIVHEVMKDEEFLHFAKILVARFGVKTASVGANVPGSAASEPERVIGLEQMQDLQRRSCADTVFERSEWLELCKKLGLDATTQHLTWMEFSEAFSVMANGKRFCAPHEDPAAVVYAALANDKVLETIKDADEDQVSQKAFTNLLRVQRAKVDDDVWLGLLQNMQTTYKYRQPERKRKSSFTGAALAATASGHGHEQPLVVIRNTRNQVLSYEIVFDEVGDIGLELQSDFLGRCVTVARTTGQAARHAIIQKHDIVAAVNGANLTKPTMAIDSADEKTRLDEAKKLLDTTTERKVTFVRQESYYQYNAEQHAMHLYLKTIERVAQNGKLRIHLPADAAWKPLAFDAESGESSLEVDFEVPKHADFEQASISWDDEEHVIEIVLDGETAIGDNSTLVLKVSGIDCGDQVALGPCELSTMGAEATTAGEDDDQPPVCSVTLSTDWHTVDGALGNPIRDRERHAGEYFDESLKPLARDFHGGDAGLTLASDFFGQCPVVTAVRRSSPSETLDVRKNDILASITSIDGKTLNQLNCIKPFALTKQSADAHINEVRKQLTACEKSGRPYHLEFLRLSSFFFHENGRTILTFNALTTLRDKTALLVKMPSTKWHVAGTLAATVVDPAGVKVREVVWDSQQHAVHLTLDSCSIPEFATVVVEIHGVQPPSKTSKGIFGGDKKTQCAGPGEVVGVFAGSGGSRAPEMEFILHEHWHSFIVGHQGIETSKINATLKEFNTSPAKLWTVLEYTSLLFEMCKSPAATTLSFEDMNRLIGLVCGNREVMTLPKWNTLCRTLGATPRDGLTRRQFACCWYDVTGLTNHSAKDVYLRIETARKLFTEIVNVFQANEESELITKETIAKLASVAGFDATKALKVLVDEDRQGWDADLFCQIVCKHNRDFQFEDEALNLWIKIFYAKKLFKDFSNYYAKRKRRPAQPHSDKTDLEGVYMKKKSFIELFAAAKVVKPKLTNDVWTAVCDSLELDETSGFSFAQFLEVYSREPLGPRDPLADYYRIETFKLLPERQAKTQEASKEAALSVAPEKVNVREIAAKALEETASAEEVFQDLLQQGLEFSKHEKIEEVDKQEEGVVFNATFAGKRQSRTKGFLRLKVGSISELADHIVTTDREFNKEKLPEELYVMFEITDAKRLRARMPKKKPKHPCTKLYEGLFGGKDIENVYKVRPDELWDNGATQALMREMHDAEKHVEGATVATPDYNAAVKTLSQVMTRLMPTGLEPLPVDVFTGRVFSSAVLRDPSPDAIVRFPDDHFRLYLEMETGSTRKLLVCKLFKRIGSELRRLELALGDATEAHDKAKTTFTILKDLVEQQQEHLRYVVAVRHKGRIEDEGDHRIKIALSKLRQKRSDLMEFEAVVTTRKKAMDDARAMLEAATPKLKPTNEVSDQAAVVAQQPPTAASEAATSGTLSAPGLQGKQLDEDAPNDASVRLIGQAVFNIENLLGVLHENCDSTNDVTPFRTVSHKDIGVLSLHFAYHCDVLPREVPPSSPQPPETPEAPVPYVTTPGDPLPHITIAMSGNEQSTTVEKIKEEIAYKYPPRSHLELHWEATGLKKGDRLCLARDDDRYKLSLPYFLLLWVPDGTTSVSATGDDGEDGDDSNESCDWKIPEVLKKSYTVPGETLIRTDSSKTRGCIQLPSSTVLSLPPGSYKLYLIRNESDGAGNNFRYILSRTPSLVVLPGENSVHTPFGTTSLIDVKPVFATLQAFAESDRWAVADALQNRDGFFDAAYLARIENEQEIEVTQREIKASEAAYEKVKHRKRDNNDLVQKIEQLTEILKRLRAEKTRLQIEARATTGGTAGKAKARAQRGGPSIISADHDVVFSYTFTGGGPLPQDRIVLLPADVVLVSDNLRSLLLGKLQGNNPRQVERIRETMATELLEVAQFFALKLSPKSVWKLVRKTLCRSKPSGSDDDEFLALAGPSDSSSFVWDECMRAFKTAPRSAKKNFLFIVCHLLDEIAARKAYLGLKMAATGANSKLAKLNAVLKVGLEIPVLAADGTGAQTAAYSGAAKGVVYGECRAVLKSTCRQGGLFVAKYVRRTDPFASDATLAEDAGELCRFGPFYVTPSLFTFSLPQLYQKLSKAMLKLLLSDRGKLACKFVGHLVIAFAKYFLGVVSLSFNVTVLAGNFDVNTTKLMLIMKSYKNRLLRYYGPVEVALDVIYNFFNGYIQQLMEKLRIADVADECYAGFFLFPVLALLFTATFVVYVVVQEDLLLKVQKIHTYLPINPGKSLLGFLEQLGALLVIPLYLTIKSCVLFISGQWLQFYDRLGDPTGLAAFKLFTDAPHGKCKIESLAKLNYGFGLAALVLIVAFLFVCLPLLLLDLYSWVPLAKLKPPNELQTLAHSFERLAIKAAVHDNANLLECGPSCGCRDRCARVFCRVLPRFLRFQGFDVYYRDYMTLAVRQLQRKYGFLGFLTMFTYVYMNLMLQSMGRSLGVLLFWRRRAPYMYQNARSMPMSSWKFYDRFCLRFNVAWKVQYIKDKMVVPFVNIVLVTLGLWSESQWVEYSVEDRANSCYLMEPSAEIKQLQMMSLHGKITSLFWLCIPKTMVLAYLAEVLNRGPVFSYFLNKKFLQADIPESERERDPVWRFSAVFRFEGEEDVVYLSETRFYSTIIKWTSSLVEIVTLFWVFPSMQAVRTKLLGIALLSAAVSPLLEFNQHIVKAYVDYKEAAEGFVSSSDMFAKLSKAKDRAVKAKAEIDRIKSAVGDVPKLDVNSPGSKSDGEGSARPASPAAPSSNGGLDSPAPDAVSKLLDEPGDDNNTAQAKGDAAAPKQVESDAEEQPADSDAKKKKKDKKGKKDKKASTATGDASTRTSVRAPASKSKKKSNDRKARGTKAKALASNAFAAGSGAAAALSAVQGTQEKKTAGRGGDTAIDSVDGFLTEAVEEGKEHAGDVEDVLGDQGAAVLFAAAGMIKPKKQLILLNAMPELSYVVLTDDLDEGEGEITVNWQINAKQRFHALDAIGMFPAREPGVMMKRTMDDCICYGLLKQRSVEPFGWKHNAGSNDDVEHDVIVQQAKSLRNVAEADIQSIKTSAFLEVDGKRSELKDKEHADMLKLADSAMDTVLRSPKLKPYAKKMSDMLEEEVVENRLLSVVRCLCVCMCVTGLTDSSAHV